MRARQSLAVLILLITMLSCAGRSNRILAKAESAPARPAPTEHRLDVDAERRQKLEREAWIEHMHRAGPDVDWRAIEKENGRSEQERRNVLGAGVRDEATSNWTEVGSSNLAGRTHVAAISPDGESLYVGSSLGGVWRGALDGTGWTPLGDNLYGGAHDLVLLPGESGGEPDVMVVATDGGDLHVSRDRGLVWESPTGIPDLSWIRSLGVLQDAASTVLVYGQGPGTSSLPTIFASVDYGRTFTVRWQGDLPWDGWMWVPRVGPGAASDVYLVHDGKLMISTDGGVTFSRGKTIERDATRAVLAGSEGSGLVLYAAMSVADQWRLYRSGNGGQTWVQKYDIDDFWESLCASIYDPSTVAYGGVEVFRSTDDGTTFTKVNDWGEYYGDPVNRLHADTPGLHCWPDPDLPGEEIWYVSTDGGTYVSHDRVATVYNLSREGLGISQYYSTLSDRRTWDVISAGAQDQGYQNGIVLHTGGGGPSTPLEQVISGDYGHLASTDGTLELVYSTYPGFVLVQEGATNPALHTVDFIEGSQHAWLPPVVADPVDPDTFYFCADYLYRYDRTGPSSWTPTQHSTQQFGGLLVDGSYLSALAFARTDPDRAYAVTDVGRLFWSTDRGVSWTEATATAPQQHYFYGNAITVHPENPLEVAVGGSGYSNAGVIRSLDGGVTWMDEADGLPATLVYALTYAEDGSGDLYAGTETGAWHWDRVAGTWSNIMGNVAPTTIYWSVEPVNDGGTVRYGTYGRGIWDYAIDPSDRDGDGVPDDLDTCANLDAGQADGDLDGRGDACDNCPELPNPGQQDADIDLAGDECDCAPQDPRAAARPGEIAGLRFTDPASMTWEATESGPNDRTEVHRDDIGAWPVGSTMACTTVRVSGNETRDTALPEPGRGFYYLVAESNICGQGDLGVWGEGSPRDRLDCDQILASFGFALYTDAAGTTPGIVGSYVDQSLWFYTVQDDWRVSQTIAGTRVDPVLDFTDPSWGSRDGVGLTGGTDENWDQFSVQWDGFVEIIEDGLRLATISDDGSRMWIDLDHDGTFDSSGDEFIDNNFGAGQSATEGPPSVPLAPGIYGLRIQYDEQSGDNVLQLIEVAGK